MQRYFIQQLNPTEHYAIIDGSDVHHIRNVMRFRIGDELIVCNFDGLCYKSSIQTITNNAVECSLIEVVEGNDLPVIVDIAQGLIRREKFEYMIQKSTELGVHQIIPIETKHTIIKLNDQKQDRKIERWNALAKEASEQSHRNRLASVTDITKLMKLPFSAYDVVLVAYEKEYHSRALKEVLSKPYQKILVIIGPEGGFDSSEIEAMCTIPNLHFVGLGRRILRSETASNYILSVISYVYEMSVE